MTGFDKDKARTNVEMPTELVPVVVIAIGKQDSHEKLSGGLAEREVAPRGRKTLEEIVLVGLPKI